jgi:hypothetical protein
MIVAAADVSRITIMNSLPRLGIDRSSDKPDLVHLFRIRNPENLSTDCGRALGLETITIYCLFRTIEWRLDCDVVVDAAV